MKFNVKDGYVYFDDSNIHPCRIDKDENGHEYIYVPNFSSNNGVKNFNKDCIKDAVEQVMTGLGDVISVLNFLGMKLISVLYFLDREYGEELKQKSIEGWKDTKFCYVIKANDTIWWDYKGNHNALNIAHFSTEEKANNFIKKMMKKSEKFIPLIERYYTVHEYDNIKEIQREIDTHPVLPILMAEDKYFSDNDIKTEEPLDVRVVQRIIRDGVVID